MRHLRLQQGVRLCQPEDVPAAVLGRGDAVSDPGVHGGTALLRLRVQDLEEGDAALAAASGSDLLSVAGDVPEDLLHGGEALPGAADRRELGCGEHPAEVFVFQPQVPDRRASAAFERSEGGDEPDRTKTGAGVLLPAVRQDDAGVPVPSEREGRAERVCPGMGEVQYEAEGEADDGSDVHPGLFVSVGHQADAGNNQGGVRS